VKPPNQWQVKAGLVGVSDVTWSSEVEINRVAGCIARGASRIHHASQTHSVGR
jgi:hypothetical protein